MRNTLSLQLFIPSLLILPTTLLSHVTQAQTVQDQPSSDRLYPHHEIKLDNGRHHEEFFSFVTRPDLDAPKWHVEYNASRDTLAPGYWFVAPYSEVEKNSADAPWSAPHIYDCNGELIWSGAPVFDGFSTFDFRVIDVNKRPMLSVIYPHTGEAHIFDETYQLHKKVDMGSMETSEGEEAMNMHEFTTVADGTKALHLTHMLRKVSNEDYGLADFDGECLTLYDMVRELDTNTWDLTNKWTSEGRIAIAETYLTREPAERRCGRQRGWAYIHANSVDAFSNGDYLLSGRATSTIYRISRDTGSIVWRLGGRESDFELPYQFFGQHAAKIYKQNDTHVTISFLDNATIRWAEPNVTNTASRGRLITLDETAMTATPLAEYPHPEDELTRGEGNMQMLPNGNVWMGWTERSLQSEHSFDGTLLYKAHFRAHDLSTYRSFKFPWIGKPSSPPDVHAAIIKKNGFWYTIVHTSWNGATEVELWNIYYTNAARGEKELVATAPKVGFETLIWADGYGRYVVAEALDKDNNTLGTSNVFSSIPPRRSDDLVPEQTTPEQAGFQLHTVAGQPVVVLILGILLGCPICIVLQVLYRRLVSSRPRRRTRGEAVDETYKPLSEDFEIGDEEYRDEASEEAESEKCGKNGRA